MRQAEQRRAGQVAIVGMLRRAYAFDDGREAIDQLGRLMADKALWHLGPRENHRHAGGFLVHRRFTPQATCAEIVAMVARIENPRTVCETGRGERVDELADVVVDKADEPEIGGQGAP